MNRKLNKKGFTLVELLAVIVILALIMVLAVPQILNVMNDSKKKNFQLYGQRFMNSVSEYYQAKELVNDTGVITKRYSGLMCIKPEDLKITATSGYQVFVTVNPSTAIANGVNQTEYKIYMTDGSFAYDGAVLTDVQNKPEIISTDPAVVSKVSGYMSQCQ